MNMAAIVLSALLLCQGADDRKVGDLIRDLGADEYSVRERAEGELRKLGDAAIPALREALKDKDPERALRAHRVLEDLEKTGRRPGTRTWTAYRDFGRGMTFEMHPDGKVELTVRERGGKSGSKDTRTYRADSLEDFRKKYPDIASKYDVDSLVPKERWSFFDDSKDSWDAWRKRFDRFLLPLFPFGSGALDNWVLNQKEKCEPEENRQDESARPQLGITVERAGSALADQLGLGADEGLVVAEVKPASRAEKAGLRRHDLLLKANGKALTGPEELRREVETGLQCGGLELEILRRGKRETLKVEPVSSPSKQ